MKTMFNAVQFVLEREENVRRSLHLIDEQHESSDGSAGSGLLHSALQLILNMSEFGQLAAERLVQGTRRLPLLREIAAGGVQFALRRRRLAPLRLSVTFQAAHALREPRVLSARRLQLVQFPRQLRQLLQTRNVQNTSHPRSCGCAQSALSGRCVSPPPPAASFRYKLCRGQTLPFWEVPGQSVEGPSPVQNFRVQTTLGPRSVRRPRIFEVWPQ